MTLSKRVSPGQQKATDEGSRKVSSRGTSGSDKQGGTLPPQNRRAAEAKGYDADRVRGTARSAPVLSSPRFEPHLTDKILAAETRSPTNRTVLDVFASSPEAPSGPAFARHETFAPRSWWLRKGFLAAAEDAQFFLADDAHLRLGVGKNMARAIRYWCHATGLLEDAPMRGGRTFASRPTPFGLQLLGPHGWDPYIEDPASLWLLHWQLVKTPALATAWHFAFTCFAEPEFDVEGLTAALAAYTADAFPAAGTAESSLKKDASCVARMYGEAPAGAVTEETIQSPFADLELLRPATARMGSRAMYRFELGRKPGLDPAVVAAACLAFAARVSPGTQTIALSRLLVEPGSPGMAFKLGEGSLVTCLEEAARRWHGFAFADAAGLVQVAFDGRPQDLAARILANYYGRNSLTVAA